MNRYKKLFSDTVILAFGTFGSKLLVFLLMPLYTALLSPTEYGTAELITGTANLLMPLACVGIANGVFRFAADADSDHEKIFSTGVFLLTIGLGITTLIGVPLVILLPYHSETLLVLLYILFADLQSVCAQYVRAIDRTKLFAVQGILNTFLTVLFNVIFLVGFDMGLTGYVLSVVVGNGLTTLVLVFAAKLWRAFLPGRIDRETIRSMLRYSLPMIPTTIFWLITDLSDRYLVAWLRDEAETGIYTAAYKIPTLVNLVSTVFMQAWQLSAVCEYKDEEACKKFYTEVFRGFLSIIFIGSGTLILLSRFLSKLMLNVAYYEAWKFMPTLLCAVALEAVVSFLATVYMLKLDSRRSLVTASIGTVLNIVLNLLLIPDYGALGAAVATLIGYGSVYLVRMADVRRYIAFKLYVPRQAVSIVLLLASAAVMTFDVPNCIWICACLTFVLAAINLPPLVGSFEAFLHFRFEKRE